MLDRARRLARDGNNDRGAVAVIVVLFVLIFMVVIAFVVDVGRAYSTRTALQGAADAAALAAVQDVTAAAGSCVTDPTAAPCVTAQTYAQSNGVPNGQASVVWPYAGDYTSVEVTVSEVVPMTFGRLVRVTSKTVTARAVARVVTTDSAGYGIFSAGLWRVNGGGTGLTVSGGGGYAGTLNFNGNEKNKSFLSPVGLESPDYSTTTKWTDSQGNAQSTAIATASKGTALQYATTIGLDGSLNGKPGVIPAFGSASDGNWVKANASGDCVIDQAKLNSLSAYQVIYCDGAAIVSGTPSDNLEMIRAATISFGGNIGWNGSSCASTVILYATTGGITNSGNVDYVCGTAYSPNGQFATNGGGVRLYQGRIIASSILLSGNGGATVSTAGDPFLQSSTVSLTE